MKKLFFTTTIAAILMSATTMFAVDSWDSEKVYANPGSQVIYNGKVYENKWWSKGESPSGFNSNQWHVWRPVENVEPTPTPDPEPDPIPNPTPSGNGWDSAAVYLGGNRVVYNGNTYEAKWWTQGENPGQSGQWGVWKLVNGNIDPDPTPDPTLVNGNIDRPNTRSNTRPNTRSNTRPNTGYQSNTRPNTSPSANTGSKSGKSRKKCRRLLC